VIAPAVTGLAPEKEWKGEGVIAGKKEKID
jgi:hypothetical protein